MLTFSYILMGVSLVLTAILYDVFGINIFLVGALGVTFYIVQLIKHFRQLFAEVENGL